MSHPPSLNSVWLTQVILRDFFLLLDLFNQYLSNNIWDIINKILVCILYFSFYFFSFLFPSWNVRQPILTIWLKCHICQNVFDMQCLAYHVISWIFLFFFVVAILPNIFPKERKNTMRKHIAKLKEFQQY